MLSGRNLLKSAHLQRDTPTAGASRGSWRMRATGWLLLAMVAGFATWFFTYTTTDRNTIEMLPLQAIEAEAPISGIEPIRARLRAVPASDIYHTGLRRPTVWLRIAIPPSGSRADRIIHLPEKNFRVAEFVIFDDQGVQVLRGRAGTSIESENARRTLPGFAIDEPSYLAGQALELIVRYEPIGLTHMSARLAHDERFSDSQVKAQQRTILLIGALMFLALYALAAANAGRAEVFLMFGVWLLARCGFVVMESGFNYFAFGDASGTYAALHLGQFIYLTLPLATLLLVQSLFAEELRDTRTASLITRAQWLAGALLVASLVMPFAVFQVTLWSMSTIGAALIAMALLHAARRARDKTTWWFMAGLACDGPGFVVDALHAVGLSMVEIPWLQAEQVSLVAALLTGMAVGTTIARERRQRIASQAAAIAVLAKYEDVYRTVPIGLVSIGANGVIERHNEGFARMFALNPGPHESLGTIDTAALDSVFPAELRERISDELVTSVECDFDYQLGGHASIRWLRILARGKPDSYEASVTDITEQRDLQETLAAAAQRDPLTGALNRLGLSVQLDEIIALQPDLEHVALCYVDLDRFKMLNDMFGHNAGDAVLIDVVARLRRVLANSTIVARLGGDEFVIVLAPADQSVQEGLAWKALDAITKEPFQFDDKSFTVTASIGVFHLIRDLGQAELIAGADRSCQEAKRKGRNQVVMCADSAALILQRRSELSLVMRLHDDQTFDEFELVAQPIVALNAKGGMACEFLLRHRDASGQLVPAGPVIAAAEQNGEMTFIDRWVLRRTLEWLSANDVATRHLDFVSLNLSGSSLNDEFFKTFVIALLQKHAAIAGRVVLEVTESVAMQDIFMTMRFVESVRQTGARIALDDFGSGYSNFASLTDVQASFLKIDGRFVNSLRQKGSASTIIRTIVLLAHELQMDCVAEWVEDEEALRQLRAIGVDYGQGHILAQPMSLDELLAASRSGTMITDGSIRAMLDRSSVPATGEATESGADRPASEQARTEAGVTGLADIPL